MSVDFVLPPQPGSTDWMDGIRTVQDVIDKNKLVVWCSACNNWFHFERDSKNTHMMTTNGMECTCGATNGFIGSSLRSERTWTPQTKPPTKAKRR